MPSSPIHRLRALYDAENCSRSQVLVGIGAHRSQTNPITIIKRSSSSEAKLNIQWDKVLLDLNRLPCDEECPPNGCKLDVYVTVRHRPGCSHNKHSEYKIGTRTFDFIGKGTYSYRERADNNFADNLDKYQTLNGLEYCKKCDEFSAHCDKLLSEMAQRRKAKESLSLYQEEIATVDNVTTVNELLEIKKCKKTELDGYGTE